VGRDDLVALSPGRSRSTVNVAVVAVGLLEHTESDVLKPFWHVGTPVVDSVSESVYGPWGSTIGRGWDMPGAVGVRPPHDTAASSDATSSTRRII